MTLYRQLSIFTVFILVAMFIGTCVITVNNSRDFLINQLHTHAEDTATMLGLSASSSIADQGTLETLANAVFDSGDYRLIRITDIHGKTLVKRSIPVTIENVPNWFVNLLSLPSPSGQSFIMKGWHKLGLVTIKSHPGYAYMEAWGNVTETLAWFSISAVVVLLIAFSCLGKILRPLSAVEQQAESIGRKEFVIQKELPKTRELRQVVAVMNKLSKNVRKMFEEQSELTESYRKQLFSNPLTGLPNRRYFNSQLNHLVQSREKFDSGALILVALDHLAPINRQAGYESGDQVLKKTAEILNFLNETLSDTVLAHISGSEFALLVPEADAKESERIASQIGDSMLELHSLGFEEALVSASVGVALYRQGLNPSEFLSDADHALRSAQNKGGGKWHRNPQEIAGTSPSQSGTGYWREKLNEIVRSGQIVLHYQPVVDSGGRILHYEVLSRIEGSDNQLIPAGVFMPMAEHQGLCTDLDKLILSTWLNRLPETNTMDKFAINLSSGSLRNPDFTNWLSLKLESHPAAHSKLIFELSEHAVLCQIDIVKNLIDRLAPFDCRLAVDHFGRGFRSFSYLSTLNIEYLKIDGGFVHEITENAENRFFVGALIRTAHELEIPVIAQCVETAEDRNALSEIHVDGYQGFYIGMPTPEI